MSEGSCTGATADRTQEISRLDPVAAVEVALAQTDPRQRWQMLRSAAKAWAETDAESALAFADSLRRPSDRLEMQRSVVAVHARVDPLGALAMLEGMGLDLSHQLVNEAMAALGKLDPSAGLAVIDSLDPGELREGALRSLFRSWARNDVPSAAAALQLRNDLTPDQRSDLARRVLQHYVPASPTEAFVWLEALPRKDYRELMPDALTLLAKTDPGEAWSRLQNFEARGPALVGLSSTILRQAAGEAPEWAADRLRELQMGTTRLQTASEIAGAWLVRDPDAAMVWVLSLPSRERRAALGGVGWRLADIDVELADSFIDYLSDSEQPSLIEPVLRHRLAMSPRRAANWITRYSHLPAYGRWVGEVASQWLADDPSSALSLVYRISDDRQRLDAFSILMPRWSVQAPRQAAKWWHRQPEEYRPESVLKNLIRGWHNAQPEQAKAWVMKLPTSERDIALVDLLGQSWTEPHEARRLVREIDDPDLRYKAHLSVLHQLLRVDWLEAEAWVEGAQLTGEAQMKLLDVLSRTVDN
ncbi:MAG: hypothetical protein AAGI67_11690 [Pseudomonadota bacterium]